MEEDMTTHPLVRQARVYADVNVRLERERERYAQEERQRGD